MFSCQHCTKSFSRTDGLKRHGDCRTAAMAENPESSSGKMFSYQHCAKSFTRKDDLKRHGDCRSSVLNCDQCGEIFNSDGDLQRHLQERHPVARATKRQLEDPTVSTAKRARLDQATEPSTSATSRCQECALEIPINQWVGHLRSLQHRANTCVVHEEGVEFVNTSFKTRMAAYRVSSRQNPTSVKESVEHLREKFIKLVGDMTNKFGYIKVGVELFRHFLVLAKDSEEVKSFNTKFRLVSGGTDLEGLFGQFLNILEKKFLKFQEKESGWTHQQLLHLYVSINKVNPLNASSYLPLPKEIEAKKAVLNIKNQDQKCFMWSVLAHLHPVGWGQDANRVANYLPYENKLEFTDMEFPIKLKDINKVECGVREWK